MSWTIGMLCRRNYVWCDTVQLRADAARAQHTTSSVDGIISI